MPVLTVIIVLAAIGAVTWAVVTYVPVTPGFKRLIVVVALVACVLWLLTVLGLLPSLGLVRVGPAR